MLSLRHLLLVLSPCLLVTLSSFLAAQTLPSPKDATAALAAHLAALKETRTLQANFICEKRLAALDTPLISRGHVLVRRGDPREGEGALRIVTETPYFSELILAKGKLLARSQHETEWTKTNQPTRPGLTTVLSQLGGWSASDTGKITDMYTISTSTASIPASPNGTVQSAAADVFTLTPTNKDLLRVVKQITFAVDRASHHLLFLQMSTQQDDATRYWFYDIKANVQFPADAFVPTTVPTTAPSAKS
ncbi:MAG: outer membrane lipoprotein carrier protein LolA [Phycisphaerales bacterium]|nr:outer membrane lipoprotein carrier protein LolA [Phycisphaerales bacterium]